MISKFFMNTNNNIKNKIWSGYCAKVNGSDVNYYIHSFSDNYILFYTDTQLFLNMFSSCFEGIATGMLSQI
jgi:tetrahydromethanopterin S-methyltransferase subunit F